jgi:hypothetical protein
MRYRRESKKRKVSKRRVLVLCEGKTEKIYLEGLRRSLPKQLQRDIDLDITKAKEGEPVKSINELKRRVAKAKKEQQPYMDYWMVFDDDNRNVNEIFGLLHDAKASYVYNSIAIEFWFLLHYRNTARQFQSADEAIEELEKDYGAYSKTDRNLWGKMSPHYETARQRAGTIRDNHERDETDIPDCKPYSNMDLLIERIKELMND